MPIIDRLFLGFNAAQKRNLFYTVGIMCHKLGLESTTLGAVKTMMTDRFNAVPATSANAFAILGLLEGLNQLLQSLGLHCSCPRLFSASKRCTFWLPPFPSLPSITLVFLILELSNGGQLVFYITKKRKTKFPTLPHTEPGRPYIVFPLFLMIGGGTWSVAILQKLKKMDATVYIWYNSRWEARGAFFDRVHDPRNWATCTQFTSPERNLVKLKDGPKRSAGDEQDEQDEEVGVAGAKEAGQGLK
ncbi:hypothetical protein BJ741DRAFT_647461 [Chytriomyces cf. hyalinus JEL632]|nr:hypothetical protein BJ741DRAFT_647461 [Chytriomyces cf. hyalinus JEL632]